MSGKKVKGPQTREGIFLRDLFVEASKRERWGCSGYGFDESDIDWGWIDQQFAGKSMGDQSGDESRGLANRVQTYQQITYKCNDCGRSWLSQTGEYHPAVPLEPCPFCDRARVVKERTRLQIEMTHQRLQDAIPPQLPYGERVVRLEEADAIFYATILSNLSGRAFIRAEIPLSLLIGEGHRAGWMNMYHWLRDMVFARMVEGGQVVLLNK